VRKHLIGLVKTYLFQPIKIAKEIYKGKLYFQKECYDDAIICFNLAVSKQRNHNESLYYLALSYYLNRDFIKSVQIFQQISKKSKYYLISKVYLNQALMKTYNICRDYVQYKDIYENLEFIADIKDKKLNFRELIAQGAACAALKKYESAEEAYLKAIHLIESSLAYKHRLFKIFCPDLHEILSHTYCLLGVTAFNFATEESKKNGLSFFI
jgi:tetratricopeptide (TPR) repeat protein